MDFQANYTQISQDYLDLSRHDSEFVDQAMRVYMEDLSILGNLSWKEIFSENNVKNPDKKAHPLAQYIRALDPMAAPIPKPSTLNVKPFILERAGLCYDIILTYYFSANRLTAQRLCSRDASDKAAWGFAS